ncbi:hypothetical protein COK03_26725 [Priestia megaterium]|uniref:hypothetical protein n=1 Tax=Priestia megaterium TaxID=1404 RepID=UPI000BF56C59|nr:hypothetical protein [Priestia megaterium]PFP33172.1 hypothetical protein COK03_26725 [Priestia megaterium]
MKLKKIFSLVILFMLAVSFFIPTTKTEASSAVIDQNLKITSVKRNSDGSIKVNYTVKKKAIDGLSIGYEWPSQYRMSSSYNYYKGINKNKGEHSLTLPKPKLNLIGRQLVEIKLNGRYTEKKNYTYVFNRPSTVKYKTHKVTKAEAAASFTISDVVPGIALTYLPQTKVIKAAGGAYASWNTYSGYKSSMNMSKSFPKPVAGHYYKIKEYYSANAKFNVYTEVYTSYESYKKGVKPIFKGTTSFNF